MKWIPVKERTPNKYESSTPLLITRTHLTHDSVELAYFNFEKRCFQQNSDSHTLSEVTAWMPLPNPYGEWYLL